MKKIKTFIIHALGLVTSEEYFEEIKTADRQARCLEMINFKIFLRQMNGMNADDWCKNAYEYVCKRIEELSN